MFQMMTLDRFPNDHFRYHAGSVSLDRRIFPYGDKIKGRDRPIVTVRECVSLEYSTLSKSWVGVVYREEEVNEYYFTVP